MIGSSRWMSTALKIAGCATLLCVLLSTRENLVQFEAETDDADSIYFVPQAKAIRPFLLGHEAFVADLIWIRTLGYFADELRGAQRYTYLYDLLELATDLDPRFEKIFMWAGAALMYNTAHITREKILRSTHFLEKGWAYIQNDTQGWRHNAEYWRIPQMIGFNYAMELHEKDKGAPFIAATARIPGSPDLYKTWAGTLYKKAGEWEKAAKVLEDMLSIEVLEGQIQSVKEDAVKQQILYKLQSYYRKLYGEDAEARFRFFQDRLSRLVDEWRQRMPYAPFNLYMILTGNDSDSVDRHEIEPLWRGIFPLLENRRI